MRRVMGWLTATFLCLLLVSASEGQDRKNWPTKGVTIGAAPVGGVYYIWAGGPNLSV